MDGLRAVNVVDAAKLRGAEGASHPFFPFTLCPCKCFYQRPSRHFWPWLPPAHTRPCRPCFAARGQASAKHAALTDTKLQCAFRHSFCHQVCYRANGEPPDAADSGWQHTHLLICCRSQCVHASGQSESRCVRRSPCSPQCLLRHLRSSIAEKQPLRCPRFAECRYTLEPGEVQRLLRNEACRPVPARAHASAPPCLSGRSTRA